MWFLREKSGREEAFCVVLRSSKISRGKKRKRVGARFFLCTLGFLPRVREVRKWATSVVSPLDFREIFINLSSISADDLGHPKSQQIKIEGVRSTSAVERVLQRTSIHEESIRSRALCGWSVEVRHTMWLHYDDQIFPTVIRFQRSTTCT